MTILTIVLIVGACWLLIRDSAERAELERQIRNLQMMADLQAQQGREEER